MLRRISFIKQYLMSLAVFLGLPLTMVANTVTTVEQVTTAVTLSEDVDYHITSATPFASGGSINITNTDHAVVVFDNVRPSVLLTLLSYIRINGVQAVNNSTCQVKIYNQGSVLMPYSSDIRPLTVFSEQNFEGTAVNDFGLENTGGFMNTLTEAKLNNKIRSFKLKRGYMVTFSTRAGGYGYSRCFVADTKDLEIKELPAILDKSITSYRVFKWNDASKKGLANNTGLEANEALNTTWCYSFGLGEDTGINRECVPHRIHETWPAIADCGNRSYTTSTPTLKTDNEPGNSADPNPATVAEVLANWPAMMATGQRLCTPSSHDGSLSWMKAFVDSIDARGWRCDVVDVHAYWATGSFYNLPNWYSQYKRPIWVTEWCWGASWNQNGAFNPSLTDEQAMAQNAENVKTICELMNSYGYVERYSFWNSEADRSKLYLNGALTAAGKYYATENSGVGYNKAYDYIPTTPKSQGIPRDLAVKFDSHKGVATLTWHEMNGEYNKSMVIERRDENGVWTALKEVDLQETEADYSVDDSTAFNGAEYRIHIIYADNKDYYTAKTATAVPEEIFAGDGVDVDGVTYYVGGNIVINGDFDMGTSGWTNGVGEEIGAPDFKVIQKGGVDGGAYLQSFSNHSADKEGSLRVSFDMTPCAMYYFSGSNCFDGLPYHRLSLTKDGTAEDSVVVAMTNNTVWTKYAKAFNTGTYSKAVLSFRWLGAKAQFDKIGIYRMFTSRDEALADAVDAEKRRAKAVVGYNTVLPQFNTLLDDMMSSVDASSLDLFTSAIDHTLEAVRAKTLVDSVASVSEWMAAERIDGCSGLLEQLDAVQGASTAEEYVELASGLREKVSAILDFENTDKVVNSEFQYTTADWVKSGTYTGGIQAKSTVAGKDCWSALWTGVSAYGDDLQTMGVSQEIRSTESNKFVHGLYVLECKALTQHYCLTDQHAYIKTSSDSAVSPNLTSEYLDMPMFSNEEKWQTLTTSPIYLVDGDTVTIGFTSSKKGAVDNAWKEYGNANAKGDQREGWWCATDFVLRRLPVYHMSVDESGWGTLCLPYAAMPTEGVTFYQIAGITSDKQYICVEEISETAAGVPCIVFSNHSDVVIQERGEAVTSRTRGANGLSGLFQTSANAGKNYLVLRNGVWVIQNSDTRSERASLEDYSAYIKNTDDMTVLDSWTGVKLPVAYLTAIDAVLADKEGKTEYFTLDGRKAVPGKSGIYLKVSGGNTEKINVVR